MSQNKCIKYKYFYYFCRNQRPNGVLYGIMGDNNIKGV